MKALETTEYAQIEFKGEQVITLQMAQQLKSKNINVVPGQLFCRQSKAKYCQRQIHCIDDQDKVQSVTDLLQTMKSLNVKHQGESSSQLAFHLSADTHL